MKTYAQAIKAEDESHELVLWPTDHDCAPSATSHLARTFTERCYKADPTKSIFQIYRDVRAELGKPLTPEEKISFLCDIPKLHSIKVQLYKHRRKFIPTAPQNFVSKILYLISLLIYNLYLLKLTTYNFLIFNFAG